MPRQGGPSWRKRAPRAPGASCIQAVERARKISALYAELGTMRAVSHEIGITPERVRQILKKAESYGVAVQPVGNWRARLQARRQARMAS